jgi:hypothetical protein
VVSGALTIAMRGFGRRRRLRLLLPVDSRPFGSRKVHISLMINIYFIFCRANSMRDLIFV